MKYYFLIFQSLVLFTLASKAQDKCIDLFSANTNAEVLNQDDVSKQIEALVLLKFNIDNNKFQTENQLMQAKESLTAALTRFASIDPKYIAEFKKLQQSMLENLKSEVSQKEHLKIQEKKRLEEQINKISKIFDPTQILKIDHIGAAELVVFSADSKYMVSTGSFSKDAEAKVIDISTRKELFTIRNKGYIHSASFSPDGKYIATGGRDRTTRIFEVATENEVFKMDHNDFVSQISFSADGKYLSARANDKTVRMVDLTKRKEIYTIRHQNSILTSHFSPDGKYILTTSMGGEVMLTEVKTGNTIFEEKYGESVGKAGFSPNGKNFFIGSHTGNIDVFDVVTGKELFKKKFSGWVYQAEYSPDGKYIFVAHTDDYAPHRLLNASTGEVVVEIERQNYVNSINFSPDSKHIALVLAGSGRAVEKRKIKVFNVITGKKDYEVEHDNDGNSAEFSLDGKYLVTASGDKTSKILDAMTGKELFLINHTGSIKSMRISLDSQYVATASEDQTMLLHKLYFSPTVQK